jgi:hypothetical protein
VTRRHDAASHAKTGKLAAAELTLAPYEFPACDLRSDSEISNRVKTFTFEEMDQYSPLNATEFRKLERFIVIKRR